MNHPFLKRIGEEPITPVYWEEFTISESWKFPASYRRSHGYAPMVAALDVETSTAPDNSFSWVYLWCMAINDEIVYGRTLDHLKQWLRRLADSINLTLDYRLCVYIHNAKFDLSFFRQEIDLSGRKGKKSDFIARSKRQIIRCGLDYLYEVRDSAVFSEMPLEMIGHEIGLEKLEENYSAIRAPETPLTVQSLQYCGRDCQILTRYYSEQAAYYGGVGKIPLTATQCVQNIVEGCFTERSKQFAPHVLERMIAARQLKTKFQATAKKPYPTEEEQNRIDRDRLVMSRLRSAFFGGFCYASDIHNGNLYSCVASADINAAYCSAMLSQFFPVDRFKPIRAPRDAAEEMQMRQGTGIYRDKALLIHVKFFGLKCRIKGLGILPSWIRYNLGYRDMIKNKTGSRVEYCSEIELILTDVDYRQIKRFYTCTGMQIFDVLASAYGKLYDYVIDANIQLYAKKSAAKAEIKEKRKKHTATLEDEIKYNRIKSRLARMYGVFVKDPIRQNFEFDPEKHEVQPTGIEQAATNFYSKVLYQWGVWVAAHARARLLDMIVKIGTDKLPDGTLRWNNRVIYADTDCIRWLSTGDDDPRAIIIAQENQKIRDKMREVVRIHGGEFEELYGFEIASDILDDCGQWEIDRFPLYKQIGLKQYVYIDPDGEFRSVVAGLPKADYREAEDGARVNVGMDYFDQFQTTEEKFDAFTEELFIPPENSKLLKAVQFNGNFELDIVDCMGLSQHVAARSGTVLVPAAYKLSRKPEEEMQEEELVNECGKLGFDFYALAARRPSHIKDDSYYNYAMMHMNDDDDNQ